MISDVTQASPRGESMPANADRVPVAALAGMSLGCAGGDDAGLTVDCAETSREPTLTRVMARFPKLG